MSGGPALGCWEVKDCKVHKALAVCKQNIRSYHDVQLPEHHIDAYAPCPPGWESNSGLLHCFKVTLSSYFFITLNKSPCTLSETHTCGYLLFCFVYHAKGHWGWCPISSCTMQQAGLPGVSHIHTDRQFIFLISNFNQLYI